MNLRISKKIPIAIAMASIITGGLAAYFSINTSSTSLLETEKRGFEAIVDSRKNALAGYLRSIEEDITTLANSDQTLSALSEYNTAWAALEGGPHPVSA